MKNLTIFLFAITLITSCKNPKTEYQKTYIQETKFGRVEDLPDLPDIENESEDEYYIFKDNYKYSKSRWLGSNTVKYLEKTMGFGSDKDGIKIMDCIMSKISSEYNYSQIKHIMEGQSSEFSNKQIKNLVDEFYSLGFVEKVAICALENGGINSNSLYKIEDAEHRQMFISSVENEFKKNPDFLEIKDLIIENEFYNCVADKVLENFTVKEMTSGEAYKSQKYSKIVDNCLTKSLKN